MKKLLYAILPILLACISCSDDDWTQVHSQKISKVYRGESLELRFNDSILSDKMVLFTTSDLEYCDITLDNVIPGEGKFIFKGVKLEDTDIKGAYTFNNATIGHEDYEVSISGEITESQILKVNIKPRIFNENIEAVSRWKLEGNILKGGIWVEIEPNNPTDSVDMKGFWGRDKIAVSSGGKNDMQALLRSVSGMLAMIVKLYVEPENNGNIAFVWEPGAAASMLPFEFKAGQTDYGFLRYNLKEDNVMHMSVAVDKMLPDLPVGDMIAGLISGESNSNLNEEDIKALVSLLQKVYSGLPMEMNFYMEGTGTRAKRKMELVIDRETLLPYAETLPKLLVPLVKDLDAGEIGESMGITGKGLAAFIEETFRVVKESKEFKLKMKFSE